MRSGIRKALRLAWLVLAASCQPSQDAVDSSASDDAGPPAPVRPFVPVPGDAGAADAAPAPDTPAPDTPAGLTPEEDGAAQPPPLSGGTLAIARDSVTAIVSDPDHDRVLLVDLTRRTVTSLALAPGDEPGRVVEDDHRRAHVVLRGAGAVVTVDLDAGALGARRAVCPLPRGVAWDPADDVIHVACQGGELVTLPAAGGEAVRRAQLDRDLRDVIVQGNRLLVTRFRAAETLVVDGRGAVTQRLATPTTMGSTTAVAWRAVAAPGGGVWLLHQRAGVAPVMVTATGYYGGAPLICAGTEGVTRPAAVRVQPPFAPTLLPDLPFAPLAVDIAVSPSGDRIAFAVPGAWGSTTMQQRQLVEVPTATTMTPCLTPASTVQPPSGQVVAVAYARSGALVAQTREPATLFALDGSEPIALGGDALRSAGHTLFHTNPTGTVACAACHAEGEDDGRVWTFAPAGPRRTPYLRGGLLGTEPFHWDGDLRDFRALVEAVMVRGMRAPMPSDAGISSLAHWIDRLPRRTAPAVEATAVARGEALFRGPVAGCTTCHAGPQYTNGATVDVGTGGTFQVPTLHGLAWHAPYLHNGCAATLRDRFGPCGGGDRHGHTSQLAPADVDDLVAFLETL